MADKVTGGRRCVIIAGSPEANVDFIRSAVTPSDYVMCADSGYAAAVKAGIKPDVVTGDFDSYTGALPGNCEVVRLRPEKDDTDTFHCVNLALERGFRRFVLLAATGGRLDHTLANLCVLEHLALRGAQGIILSEKETVMLLAEGTHCFNGRRGQTFSVFPFGCGSVELTYKGARYPLNRGKLTHSFPMGVSNVFESDEAEITVHDGQGLILLYCLQDL